MLCTTSNLVVRLSAVAIMRGPEFLVVHNPRWGAFTLPMTKRGARPDPQAASGRRHETPRESSIRAAVEALGRPLGPHEVLRPIQLPGLRDFQQSGRDGAFKHYRFGAFVIELAPAAKVVPLGGVDFAWLPIDELRSARSISPTAIRIASAI